MADLATIKRCVTDLEPGEWQIEHAQQTANGTQIFVLRDAHSQNCLALRNDTTVPGARRVVVPGIGQMTLHPVLADTVFTDLRPALECYESVHILRYRPGKRITIAARDKHLSAVILKCTATGIAATFTKQTHLWAARNQLGFMVSCPIARANNGSYFVQHRLPGEPLTFDGQPNAVQTARQIAASIATLHAASIEFREAFDFDDQSKRTTRYLHLIANIQPSARHTCRGLATQLNKAHDAIVWPRATPLTPIHGSLHRHQWLRDKSKLGLVDFDRACMGHPELDIATFLAEWDFEKEPYSQAVKQAFLDEYARSSPLRLSAEAIACYRAHKHVSKAYKASKSNLTASRADKVCRNLASAQRILAGGT